MEQYFQNNNDETSQCDVARSRNGATLNWTESYSDDEAIIPLLQNEEITSHVEGNNPLSDVKS